MPDLLLGWPRPGRGLALAALLFLLAADLLAPARARSEGPSQEQPQGQEQGQEPPQEEIFFASVDVNVVNVEVFVTDSKGHPVEGLRKEDFELEEAGKPVAVTHFLAIREGRVATDEEGTPTAYTPIPQNQRLHVVLFLDHFNMAPKSRNEILTQLRRFLLESLDNQDRVMLVSFDGTLHVERNFTSVPELLQPLLDQMDLRNSRAFEVEAGMRNILREIESVSLSDSNASVNFAAEQARGILASIGSFSQELHDRNRFTLEAMGRLVDSLAGLPGRKALVYVSNGMSLRPGETLLAAWNNKFERFAATLGVGSIVAQGLEFDSSPDFQKLVSRASANRVVIYTIDALSQRDFGAVAAEVGGFDISAVGTAGGGLALPTELSRQQSTNFRSSMQLLAAGTGGLTFVNSRALGQNLSLLANDFKTYYSLGYTPERTSDGKYRNLKVKVRGGSFRVRHRSGYRDKTVDEEMEDQTLSALLLNVTDNPLGITLERAPDRKAKKKIYEVPILVKIPIGKLTLLPGRESHQGKVQVFIAVSDSEGGNSRVEKRTLPVSIPSDKINEALSQYIGHELTLKMHGGFHRLAVSVRDEIAAVSSTVRVNFRVGK